MPPAFAVAPVSVALSCTDPPVLIADNDNCVATVGLFFAGADTVSVSLVHGLTALLLPLSPEYEACQ